MRKWSRFYVGLSTNAYILEFWARGFSLKDTALELKAMGHKVHYRYIRNRYVLHDRECAEYSARHISCIESQLLGSGVPHTEQVALTVDTLDDLVNDFGMVWKPEPTKLNPALEAYCARDAALFSHGIEVKNSPLVNLCLDFPN